MKGKKQKDELTLAVLPIDQADVIRKYQFPIVVGAITWNVLTLKLKDEVHGMLCCEYPNKDQVVIHTFIPEKFRATEYIMPLRQAFDELLIPYWKDDGAKEILVSCAYEDDKTARFFDLFGFNSVPVWIGSRKI